MWKVAQSFGGTIAMPIFVWMCLNILIFFIFALGFFIPSIRKALNKKLIIFLALLLIWGVHLIVLYYTVVNVYTCWQFVLPAQPENKQVFFTIWSSCIKMSLISTWLILANSFLIIINFRTKMNFTSQP